MQQPIPPHVQAAWDSGDKIRAIKLLREATGLGLAEAKELLENGPSSPASPNRSPGQQLPAHVRAALNSGDEIGAIELLREATGLGLKEAKDLVDAAGPDGRRGRQSLHHGSSPGEVPRGSSRFVFPVAVVVALVAAAWFYFKAD